MKKYRLIDWYSGCSDTYCTKEEAIKKYNSKLKEAKLEGFEIDLGVYEIIKEDNQIDNNHVDYTRRYNEQDITDKLFIQEILNDLERNGYQGGGKAQQLLKDWSSELRGKSGLRGKTKETFIKDVGVELW